MKITIEISDQLADVLTPLASCIAIQARTPCTTAERVAMVLGTLASTAAAGVVRPGAWERQWIEQALGPVPSEWLEPDPEASWRVRVRGALR